MEDTLYYLCKDFHNKDHTGDVFNKCMVHILLKCFLSWCLSMFARSNNTFGQWIGRCIIYHTNAVSFLRYARGYFTNANCANLYKCMLSLGINHHFHNVMYVCMTSRFTHLDPFDLVLSGGQGSLFYFLCDWHEEEPWDLHWNLLLIKEKTKWKTFMEIPLMYFNTSKYFNNFHCG